MKKQHQKLEVKESNTIKRISYLLMIVVAILFVNTLNHEYNLDDDLVTNNHPLTSKGLSSVGEIFTSSYFVDNMGHAYGYRPVVLFSFALEHQIFGENPAVSHLINVFLYLTLVLTFFRLLNRFFGPEKVMMSALIALIFAVHPIHSEVVASIKNRDELLALLFAVWSANFMIRYISSKQIKHLLFVVIFFTIGLLAKKSIFPLAFVFPIVLVFFQKPNVKEFLLLSLAFLIPATIVGSELDPLRLLIIGSLGIGLLYVVYIVNNGLSNEKDVSKLGLLASSKIQVALNVILIGVISGVSLIVHSPLIMLGLIPFLLIRHKESQTYSLAWIAFSLLVVSKLSGNTVSESLSLVALLWTLIKNPHFFLKRHWPQWLLLIIGCLLFILYPKFEFGNVVLTILAIAFFLMLQRKLVFALILYTVIIVSSVFTGSVLLPIALGTYLIIHLLIKKSETVRFDWLYNAVLGSAILVFSFGTYVSLEKSKETTQLNYATQWSENNKSIKEGRPLTYVENTLVKDAGVEEVTATGIYTIGEYLRLMIAPVKLSFYYGYARIKTVDFSNVGVWVSLLAYLALFLLAWQKRNDRPEITIGIVWFIMSIFLFSNWFELVAGMVGERLAFSASAGFSILAGALLFWWRPTFNLVKPKSQDWIIISVLFVMAILIIRRNHLWKDRFTLMSHDIEYLSTSAQAHNLFGLALMNAANSSIPVSQQEALQMKRQAFDAFDKATIIYPDFFNAQFDKGRVLVELGDFRAAQKEFKKAYLIDTTNALALEEIIKSGFEAKLHSEVVKYSQIYFKRFQSSELIFELVAYSYLLNRDFVRCEQIATKGNKLFPENPNLKRMITDARNKVIL
jgi:tetratricopeptide (TPR) repeat protein